MQARLEAQKVSPAADQAMPGLEMFFRKQSKLGPAPIQPVKMRTSSKGRRFSAFRRSRWTGPQPVVVLSYKFWQRHFNANPDVVSQTPQLNRKGYKKMHHSVECFPWGTER